MSRRRHELVEHAVDAEAHPEDLLVWLEVDVGGTAPDRVDQDHVDELHHRRLVGRFLELEDVDLGGGVLGVDHLDVADLALQLGHDLGDGGHLDVVIALDRLAEGRLGRHHRQHLEVRHERDVVEREHVGGIGHGQGQGVARPLDGKHLVLFRDLARYELEDFGIDVELRQGDRRNAVLPGEEPDQLILVDEVQPDENGAELLARSPLLGERARELVRGDQPFRDEQVTQPPTDRLSGSDRGHTPAGILYPPKPFQRIRKGLVGVLLVEDEDDPQEAASAAAQVVDDGVHHRVRGPRWRNSAHAGPEGGEGDGSEAMLVGELEG
jgi:hypothetical protein